MVRYRHQQLPLGRDSASHANSYGLEFGNFQEDQRCLDRGLPNGSLVGTEIPDRSALLTPSTVFA